MKKTYLTVAVFLGLFAMAEIALAATPEINGDIRIRIQDRSGDTTSSAAGTLTITRLRLNVDLPVSENISVYSRLAIDQAAGRGHNNGVYDTEGVLDRWGVNWKFKNGAMKLGKQDVVLGQDGLVLTTLIDAVGENNQMTGLAARWKEGKTTFQILGGRLGEGLFQPLPKVKANLYALQIDHQADRRLSVGATYRQIAAIDQYSSALAKYYLPQHTDVLTTYSLLASYYLDGKTKVYTEFGFSSADQHNRGIGFGLGHRMDKKNSYSINYFKQGVKSGLFGNWGSPDFTSKGTNTSWTGYALYYRHHMDNRTMLEVSDYYELGNEENRANQFRVTLMANF